MSLPATAQWSSGLAYDAAFGNEGVAAVPQLDTSAPGTGTIGFVQLPLSGGYIFFSAQEVGTSPYIVATRFTDDGALDTSWGGPRPPPAPAFPPAGNLIYALPIPDIDAGRVKYDARVAVGLDGPSEVEKIFLAAKFTSSGKSYLYVANFDSSGTLHGYSVSPLPVSFAGGPGSVVAVTTGVRLVSSGSGALVTVRGSGSETSRYAFVQAYGDPIFLDDTASFALSRVDLAISDVSADEDGTAEIVGTESGQALYAKYDASSKTLLRENTFGLQCPTGKTNSASADRMLRNAPLGTDVLLLARVNCSADTDYDASEVARVSSIESTPNIISRVFTGISSGVGGCDSPFTVTPSCGLESLSADAISSHVVALTPGGSNFIGFYHFDIADRGLRMLGTDHLTDLTKPIPFFGFGLHHRSPFVTGIFGSASGISASLRRLDIDRTFAADQEP